MCCPTMLTPGELLSHHSCPPASSLYLLCSYSTQSHLCTLETVLQCGTSPLQPLQGAHLPELPRLCDHAVGSHAPLQALLGHLSSSCSPAALCTGKFHHKPLTKVPFVHERRLGTLFHQQTSGGCTKVLMQGCWAPVPNLDLEQCIPSNTLCNLSLKATREMLSQEQAAAQEEVQCLQQGWSTSTQRRLHPVNLQLPCTSQDGISQHQLEESWALIPPPKPGHAHH